MHPLKITNFKKGPERQIQERLIKFLRAREWYVKILHGNQYQQGMPDLFACQRRFGARFIEVKVPEGHKFMQAQVDTFKAMSGAGVGVWVLTGDSEAEYKKLFKTANWYQYLTPGNIDSKKPNYKEIKDEGPEAEIRRELVAFLKKEKWFVKLLHGNLYQHGLPDLFVCRKGDGWRFIEVKNPEGYRFTGAQLETFPILQGHGVGIWILTSVSEYDKLFKPPQWYEYLKKLYS